MSKDGTGETPQGRHTKEQVAHLITKLQLRIIAILLIPLLLVLLKRHDAL